MRFFYLMPRVVLLIFGVSYFVLWIWHPIQSDGDGVLKLLGPAMNYLFPALFYSLSAILFLPERAGEDPTQEAPPRLRGTTLLFVLAAVLYLPLLFIVASEEGLKEVKLRPTLSTLLGICFILLFIVFCCEQSSPPAERTGGGKAQRFDKFGQRVRSMFLRAAGWLHPGLLLGGGAILVLASLFLPVTNSTGFAALLGKESWITSISDVTGGIEPIQSTKAFLGRAFYMISLGMALTAIAVMFRRGFRSHIPETSRLRTGLTRVSSFLAIYSAADLNFGWLGLSAESRTQHWTLFCMWLAFWLLPLAQWAWVLLQDHPAGKTRCNPDFSWFILIFLPVLFYDAIMAPVLVGDFLNLTGLASYIVGLQFLCWGFVRPITMRQ